MPREINWNKIIQGLTVKSTSWTQLKTIWKLEHALDYISKSSAENPLKQQAAIFCSSQNFTTGFRYSFQEEYIALICSQVNRWRQKLMEWRPQPGKKFEASSSNIIPACLLLFNHFKAESNREIFRSRTFYQQM